MNERSRPRKVQSLISAMLRKKSLQSSLFPWNLTPTTTPELSPTSSSSDSESDEDMESSSGSRPHSLAVSARTLAHIRPTLDEVLANAAPAPYTLSAFMAYLSQNHCLETLEFTLEATRYRESYEALTHRLGRPPTEADGAESQHLLLLWQRLLTAYVLPGAPREINLSSVVRDDLLQHADTARPPPPETLDPAVKRIHDLMDESIFIPFLNSYAAAAQISPQSESPCDDDDALMADAGGSFEEDAVQRIRSRRRRRSRESSMKEMGPHCCASGQYGRGTFMLGPVSSLSNANSRATGHTSTTSSDSTATSMTEDSCSYSSVGEPMTPPTTPPSSDMSFDMAHSPKSRSDNPWKKMGMKLGFKRRSGPEMPKP